MITILVPKLKRSLDAGFTKIRLSFPFHSGKTSLIFGRPVFTKNIEITDPAVTAVQYWDVPRYQCTNIKR